MHQQNTYDHPEAPPEPLRTYNEPSRSRKDHPRTYRTPITIHNHHQNNLELPKNDRIFQNTSRYIVFSTRGTMWLMQRCDLSVKFSSPTRGRFPTKWKNKNCCTKQQLLWRNYFLNPHAQLEKCIQWQKTRTASQGHDSRWPELENILEDCVNTPRAGGRGVNTVQIRLTAASNIVGSRILPFCPARGYV